MHKAVSNGAKESPCDFLRAFGSRHHGYGGSKQQEAYDFLEKLFREIEAEETGAGGSVADDMALVKDLFSGQTMTRVGLSCCFEIEMFVTDAINSS